MCVFFFPHGWDGAEVLVLREAAGTHHLVSVRAALHYLTKLTAFPTPSETSPKFPSCCSRAMLVAKMPLTFQVALPEPPGAQQRVLFRAPLARPLCSHVG